MQSFQSKMDSLRAVRKIKSKMSYAGPSVEVDVDLDSFKPRIVRALALWRKAWLMLLGQVNRHGVLPECTCVAFDSVHGLVAVGNRAGSVKVYVYRRPEAGARTHIVRVQDGCRWR